MKNLEKDILKDTPGIKEMPFAVPENYFDGLKRNLRRIPMQTEKPRVLRWGRIIAMAASFTLLVAAGGFFLGRSSSDELYIEDDYLVYSDDMTISVDEEYYDQYAEAWSVTDEDIIEYLLATGIEIEEVESY